MYFICVTHLFDVPHSHIIIRILNDDSSDLLPHMWSTSNGKFNPTDRSAKSNLSDQNKLAVMKDIRAKWSHFSEQEVSALKGKADLVTRSLPSMASSRRKPSVKSTPC
jgi:hypothetical protein